MDLNSRYKYATGGAKFVNGESVAGDDNRFFEIFITPEVRAYQAKFADPLTQCFKLMVDFDKPYGLLADESHTDSALAYLNRIGETIRYEMLVRWIEIFKIFIKNYDFLILGVEGLDTIVNMKPHEVFTETNKLVFNIRETSDMLCQSLITQYRHIWYDNERGVEVLPANLRRFDISVLVFSAGYYNMALYDVLENNGLVDSDVETKIFPTIKKLSDKHFHDNSNNYGFNHHLITLGDAQIDNDDSGKSFFSSITNEPSSDFIKNTLSLNYRFAEYKGTFNNLFGEFDFVKALAFAAAQDRFSNEVEGKPKEKASMRDFLTNAKTKQKASMKDYFAKTKDAFKNNTLDTVDKLKSRPKAYMNSIISANTSIGNALKNITDPNLLPNLVKNTIDLGIQNIENRYVFDPLTRLNNMVMKSFSDNLVSVYNNYLSPDTKPNNSVKLMSDNQTVADNPDKPKSEYSPGSVPSDLRYGTTFGTGNVYNRRGF